MPGTNGKNNGRKTSVKTKADRPLRTPAHGGGKLMVGGTNRGGPGRPTSAIRDVCKLSFEKRIAKLNAIVDSKKSSDADRIRAMDLLGKYGVGVLKEVQGAQHTVMEIVLVDEGAGVR